MTRTIATICATALTGLMLTPSEANAKKNPYARGDGSWISLSGVAENTGPDSFILDYGEGTVLVEMDDWDWYKEGYKLLNGDDVTVYGRIDDDMLETTKLEAGSVYVDSINTYFYANAYDEEGSPWLTPLPTTMSETTIQGKVATVTGREFTVDVGPRKVTIETDEMGYNPMDDIGYQKVEKGDWVRVSGEMDRDLFEQRKLEAGHIVTMTFDTGKNGSS